MANPRLVVIDNIADGTSKAVKDASPKPFFIMADGHKITELWYNNKNNSHAAAGCDIQNNFSFNIEPGARRFIHCEYPPFSEVKKYAVENKIEVNEKDFLMHNTTTVDFAVVLKGEMHLLTENGIVHLKTGDCVVQKATVHGWLNPGQEVAEMLFVMIGAEVSNTFKPRSVETKIPVELRF